MASFRIHEDQENQQPQVRQRDTVKTALQQKRTVLGILDNKIPDVQVTQKLGPQSFADLKYKDENSYAKVPTKKPIPAVPVAQFEAFKVHEDKPKEKTDDTTVKDVKVVKNSESSSSEESFNDSPMSIEKSISINISSDYPKYMFKRDRDLFFEIPEYREDIHLYLREVELRNRPKVGYMKKQPDITYSMRTILVDWLVEVAEEYRLQTETLYLAVSYIDRFLSYMSVVRAKLQLVGTAAMFIASKYEEIYPPDVGEFVYITDDTYNKRQVLRMEQLILKVLSFDLSIPTPLTFLTKYCVSNGQCDKVKYLAMYLSELCMLDVDRYLVYLPSVLAAAAIYVARDTLELEPWTEDLVTGIGYTEKVLMPCIEYLSQTFASAANLPQQAIQEKYKSIKYQHASMLLPRCNASISKLTSNSSRI